MIFDGPQKKEKKARVILLGKIKTNRLNGLETITQDYSSWLLTFQQWSYTHLLLSRFVYVPFGSVTSRERRADEVDASDSGERTGGLKICGPPAPVITHCMLTISNDPLFIPVKHGRKRILDDREMTQFYFFFFVVVQKTPSGLSAMNSSESRLPKGQNGEKTEAPQ